MQRFLMVALCGLPVLASACSGCVDIGLIDDTPDAGDDEGATTVRDAAMDPPDASMLSEEDAGMDPVDSGPRQPWDAGPGGCTMACGTWRYTTSLPLTLNRHTATLLGDGRVLIAGGDTGLGPSDGALLFDPDDESWTMTGKLRQARYNHTATLLPSGEVLVVGGVGNPTPDSFGSLRSAEVYSPTTGTWRQVPNLPSPRSGHSATLTSDGTVLVAGGTSETEYLRDLQLYAPMTSTFVQLGNLTQPRYVHAAAALSNRRVLIIAGLHISTTLTSTEMFNGTGIVAAPDIPSPRWGHEATELDDGRILVTGGYNMGPSSEAYVFTEMANAWGTTQPMQQARWAHAAVRLVDGRVMIIGGTRGGDTGSTLAHCEMFDPMANAFTETGWMGAPRLSHSATRLRDGRVLVVGGTAEFDQHDSAEIYTP